MNCIVLNEVPENPQALHQALTKLGMTPLHNTSPVPHDQCLEVVLEGGLVGVIRKNEAQKFANKLRVMKTRGEVRRNRLSQSHLIMCLFVLYITILGIFTPQPTHPWSDLPRDICNIFFWLTYCLSLLIYMHQCNSLIFILRYEGCDCDGSISSICY